MKYLLLLLLTGCINSETVQINDTLFRITGPENQLMELAERETKARGYDGFEVVDNTRLTPGLFGTGGQVVIQHWPGQQYGEQPFFQETRDIYIRLYKERE